MAAPSEQRLRAKRDAFRLQATRLCDLLQIIPDVSSPITTADFDNLSANMSSLTFVSQQLQLLNNDIDPFLADTDLSAEIADNLLFNKRIDVTQRGVQRLLNAHNPHSLPSSLTTPTASPITLGARPKSRPLVPPPPSTVPVNQNLNVSPISTNDPALLLINDPVDDIESVSDTSTSSSHHYLNLPRIEIRRFTGDPFKWSSFWSQFNGAIHVHPDLTPVQKLYYLKTLLDGEPLSAIADYEEHSDNYSIAVKILTARYGNPQLLQSIHTRALVKAPPVSDEKDKRAVRELHSHLRLHVTALQRLKVDIEPFYPLIKPQIPETLYDKFVDSDPQHESLATLVVFLQRIVDNFDRRGNPPTPTKPPPPPRFLAPTTVRRNLDRPRPAAELLHVTTTAAELRDNFCVICDVDGHGSRSCMIPRSLMEKTRVSEASGRCVQCFLQGHRPRDCNFPYEFCRRCNQPHFQTMCPNNPRIIGNSNNQGSQQLSVPRNYGTSTPLDGPPRASINTVSFRQPELWQSVLGTARVRVTSSRSSCTALCLFDSGSQRTFIQRQLCSSLLPRVDGFETVITGVFGGVEAECVYQRVSFDMLSRHDSQSLSVQALVIDIPSNYHFPAHTDMQTFSHILQSQCLPLADGIFSASDEIQIILGMDFYCRVVTGNTLRLSWDLLAMETIFGWTVHGRVPSLQLANTVQCHNISVTPHTSTVDVASMWKTESLQLTSQADKRDLYYKHLFEQSTLKIGRRYCVKLPWLPNRRQLMQSNRAVALSRYRNLVHKLSRDPTLFDNYAEAIEAYVRDGHAELVSQPNIDPIGCYYLPHQPVYSEHRSTKTRIVFDASSHAKDALSLNDCLFPGFDRSLSCLKTLIPFRLHRWAIAGDIKKAFLQIWLHDVDRDAVRFMWMKDRQHPYDPPSIYRMNRVLFGVTSSPHLLRQVIKLHASQFITSHPLAAKLLLDNFYVDDLVASVPSSTDVLQVIRDVSSILQEAGFELHKLATNHLPTMSAIYHSSKHPPPDTTTVLGLTWNIVSDELMLQPPWERLPISSPATKRSVVSLTSAIYDPLGMVAPVVIRARLIFQLTWIRRIGWDEPLPADLQDLWTKWLREARLRAFWSIPRQFLSRDYRPGDDVWLHIFSDASNRAYGAVAYAVSRSTHDGTNVAFIMSRFYVAPILSRTVPELELKGAVVSTEIATFLSQLLPGIFTHRVFWTDSDINLQRIRSQKPRPSPFVNHRVQLINKSTTPDEWRHVSSEDNPADLATKFRVRDPLTFDSAWWTGPKWLALPPDQWPAEQPPQYDISDDCKPTITVNTCNITPADIFGIHRLINIDNVSTWQRLIAITTTVVTVLFRMKRLPITPLQARQQAINLWIRSHQHTQFPEVYTKLVKHQPVPLNSPLLRLRPFIDDDLLIHITSRFVTSKWLPQVTQPLLLDRDHRLTELLITDTHISNIHAGVSTTLTILRQNYWIVSGRRMCKKTINQCMQCQRMGARPFQQPCATLPPFRSAEVVPFSYVGVDYAGPVFVTYGKVSVKSYIILFTCATSRAVHLELVTSATSREFIMAFKRFIARRGLPLTLYSDNGPNLRCAAKELTNNMQVFPAPPFHKFCLQNNIGWMHITERAPWWGGFWERMVRSIKEPLRKILGRNSIEYHNLHTLLCEIESAINSRPLAAVHDQPGEMCVITPAHLLLARPLQQVSNVSPLTKDPDLMQQWATRNRLFNHYIKAWRQDYIFHLRSMHFSQPKTPSHPYVDQVVLLDETPIKRQLWQLARITQVQRGRDGLVRSCEVVTLDGRLLRRPIQLLIPLPSINEVPSVTAPPGTVAQHVTTTRGRGKGEGENEGGVKSNGRRKNDQEEEAI